METVRLHVVLLTKPEDRKQIESLSQSISTQKNLVVLSDNMIPHITVYNPEIPKDNYDQACDAMERIADKYTQFDIDFDSFEKPPRGDNGIFINYKNAGTAQSVFQEIVGNINVLRDGVVRMKYKNADDVDGQIEKYGYPLGRYHFPHVTLARFETTTERDQQLNMLQDKTQDPYKVTSIAIVETGDYGTARKIVKEYFLQK